MFGIGKKPKLDYSSVGSHWKITNPISVREDYNGPSTCIAKAEYSEDDGNGNGNMKIRFRNSSKEYDYPVSREEVERFRNEADGNSWGRTFLKYFSNRSNK